MEVIMVVLPSSAHADVAQIDGAAPEKWADRGPASRAHLRRARNLSKVMRENGCTRQM